LVRLKAFNLKTGRLLPATPRDPSLATNYRGSGLVPCPKPAIHRGPPTGCTSAVVPGGRLRAHFDRALAVAQPPDTSTLKAATACVNPLQSKRADVFKHHRLRDCDGDSLSDENLSVLGLRTEVCGKIADRADRGVARALGKTDPSYRLQIVRIS